MKIIDAYWEKRNMGIAASEVILNIDDEISHIIDNINSLSSQYIVVKLPICRVDISFILSSLGFTFVETMNHLTHNLELAPLGKRKLDIYNDTQFLPMTKADIEILFDYIKKGIYKTDRVYLDPSFTPQNSANRYIGWINDEVEHGSEMYKLVYGGKTFGFVGFKKLNNNEYQEYIYGIYPEYQGRGLAFNITYKLVDLLKKRNVESIHIDISSNNMASMQSKLRTGYMLNSFTYVYVKHT